MTSKVVELHLHDMYSPLDGYSTPEEYMKRASELEMTHIAQTNHGTNAGHRVFHKAATDAGIVPILGMEAYISPTDMYDRRGKAKRKDGTNVYNHIILLAQGETGLKTLNRLSRKAWEEGFYHKPRIDTDLLLSDNEGLVVLSGCLNGLIAKQIEQDDRAGAVEIAAKLRDGLGDRFYMEVQGSNPTDINVSLLEIADELGIEPVATSDCHYANKEDLWAQEATLILQTMPGRNTEFMESKARKMDFLDRYNYLYPDRVMTFEEIEIFLRDYKTHKDLFESQDIYREDIYENTLKIANQVEEYNLPRGLDLLPKIADNDDAELRKLAMEGMKKRGLAGKKEYEERIEKELKIIQDKKFSPYFLVVADLMGWAHNEGMLLGPGRGSAAGSLLCYVLNITQLDPIEYDLLFERFIDYSRDDYPDIDMDFPDRYRKAVKIYLTHKYGNVASIATFSTFGGKESIKGAGRALGVAHSTTNQATRDNDAPDDSDYFEHFKATGQSRDYAAAHPDVVKLGAALNGRIKGMGLHASGFVISSRPLDEVAPMETGKDPNSTSAAPERISYIAVDMNEAADIGLIKLDVLGLSALSILEDAAELIEKRHGEKIDYYNLPLDDSKVYDLLSSGDSVGIFQAEGAAFKKWLKETKCEEFNDLVIGTSISRPGPMKTIGPEYKKRLRQVKNGRKVRASNPVEEAIVGETLSCVVYQEQVMKYMTDLAGMSGVEANEVRKIIGKKKTDSKSIQKMEEYFKKFVQGCSENIGEERAVKLWKDFEKFSGYAFNKSHAVSYSLITYWSAWVKQNYPIEFMTACMRNSRDKAKKTNYILEAKRMGLKMKLPHVNKSEIKTSIIGDEILFGLVDINGILDNTAETIVSLRPFHSVKHLEEVSKKKNSGLNSRVVANLKKVGATPFSAEYRVMPSPEDLYSMLGYPSFPRAEWIDYGRLRSFSEYTEEETFMSVGMFRSARKGKGWILLDFIDSETSQSMFAYDLDISLEKGKQYLLLISNNKLIRAVEVVDNPQITPLTQYAGGQNFEMSEGEFYPISFVTRKTKKGDTMGNVIVIDYLGSMIDVVVFPSKMMDAGSKIKPGAKLRMLLNEKPDGGIIYNGSRAA